MTSNVHVGGAYEPLPKVPVVSVAARSHDLCSRHTGEVVGRQVPRPRWERRFALVVASVDVAAVLLTAALGVILGWGDAAAAGSRTVSVVLGLLVTALTLGCLMVARAWDPRILGHGSEELSRLFRAFFTAAVVLGLAGLALQLPVVRPWVFLLLPLAGSISLAGRFATRKWLHRRRATGLFTHPTLVVASVESAVELISRTRRDMHAGWSVTGVCTPTGAGVEGGTHVMDVPVVGDLDSVADIASSGSYRVVAFGRTPGWSAPRLHQLAWDLEDTGTDLVVDPGLMESAGPRLHLTPVDGFPLIRLTHPVFEGFARVAKRVVDRVGAAVLLVLTLPVLIVVACAVRTDGGPVLFRQVRVGLHGQSFQMIKFRSMVVNAESLKAGLQNANNGAGPLFKMRRDPRVTRVGAVLRRYSLDELPQLLNVLGGSMSLVGPRPPLPEEAATYERAAKRRLLVRPGMTGLWQVEGRSDLSWEESVRLDLRYVENWSLAMDALIIWKTAGAVVRGRGGY